MPIPTGDNLTGSALPSIRRIELPADTFLWGAVTGALLPLIDPDSWEQLGTMSPELAALFMSNMFNTYLEDTGSMVIRDTFDNLPSSATEGDVFIQQDGDVISYWQDGDWRHTVRGRVIELPEGLGVWSWHNEANSTADDSKGYLNLFSELGNGLFSALERPSPPTPYTIRALIASELIGANVSRSGLFLRDTSSGRITHFGARYGSSDWGFAIHRFNDVSSFHSQVEDHRSQDETGVHWLQIDNDGTDIRFYKGLEIDNLHFVGEYSIASWAGADRVGLVIGCTNASGEARETCYSWEMF